MPTCTNIFILLKIGFTNGRIQRKRLRVDDDKACDVNLASS